MNTSKATLTRKAITAVKAAVRALPSGSTVEPSVLITTPSAMTHAEKDAAIMKMLDQGFSFLDIQSALKCGPNRISRVNRARPSTGTPAATAQVPAPAVINPAVTQETQETPARELAGIVMMIKSLESRKDELKKALGEGDHGEVVITTRENKSYPSQVRKEVAAVHARAIAAGQYTATTSLVVSLPKKK